MTVFLAMTALPAWGACTLPDGVEGELVYNKAHKVVQYCDGDKWLGLGGKGGAGGMDSQKIGQTSEYVKEFSGTIVGPSDWPACTLPAKIVTLGRIAGESHHVAGFLDIRVFGTHAGYNNTNYFEYKHWVAQLSHQRISSLLVNSAGGTNTVNLWNGSAAGNYNGTLITSDFDVRLRIEPSCGSGRDYTYVVQFSPAISFTPNEQRVW